MFFLGIQIDFSPKRQTNSSHQRRFGQLWTYLCKKFFQWVFSTPLFKSKTGRAEAAIKAFSDHFFDIKFCLKPTSCVFSMEVGELTVFCLQKLTPWLCLQFFPMHQNPDVRNHACKYCKVQYYISINKLTSLKNYPFGFFHQSRPRMSTL